MPSIAFAVPILPGKTKDMEQFARELLEHKGLDEIMTRYGVAKESWYLQESPKGDSAVVVFDADDPARVLREFADAQGDFEKWEKKRILEITGVNFDEPTTGPPSRAILDWPRR